MRLTSFNFIEN